MGKKTNNQIQQGLIQQNQQQLNNYNQAFAAAQQKSPIEQDQENEYLDWKKFMAGGDYRNAPVIFAGRYRTGAANREGERVGLGAQQLAQAYANPTAIAAQKAKIADSAAERTSGDYAEALSNYDAQMRGQGQFVLNTQQNRLLNLASQAGQMSSNSTRNMIDFQPAPSPWWGIAAAAVGGVSGMFQGRYGAKKA